MQAVAGSAVALNLWQLHHSYRWQCRSSHTTRLRVVATTHQKQSEPQTSQGACPIQHLTCVSQGHSDVMRPVILESGVASTGLKVARPGANSQTCAAEGHEPAVLLF